MIVLHDHINPNQEVYIDAKSISVIRPFGSGSIVVANGEQVPVHENPSQVMALVKEETA